MPKMPWDYHADLAHHRLQLVAKLLRDTRRETLALHDPGAGDTAWSLGCRVYARSTEMLVRAAEELWPWFSIVQSNLEFIFKIGAVPLRFYHGDPDHPEPARFQAVAAEMRQLGLAFGDARSDLVWRIVVETNLAGDAENIALIGSDSEGSVDCSYVIPDLDESVHLFEPRRPDAKPGVELPPPIVTSRRDARKKDDDGRGV
jgi:hypothetical protein